jgi:hypothetical protein
MFLAFKMNGNDDYKKGLFGYFDEKRMNLFRVT